uniref:Uncharacterized protein n=1 Tax=uncultured marine Nitrospinaceae bacterium TaxID=482920 RepID=A4GJ44_9BACT|nr:hypothetical protein [uncultured marine Nitrospinaceae bacterium]
MLLEVHEVRKKIVKTMNINTILFFIPCPLFRVRFGVGLILYNTIYFNTYFLKS